MTKKSVNVINKSRYRYFPKDLSAKIGTANLNKLIYCSAAPFSTLSFPEIIPFIHFNFVNTYLSYFVPNTTHTYVHCIYVQ